MNRRITIVGAGYVGLSMAVLFSQQNDVTLLEIIPEKVKEINNRISPLKDEDIESYFAEKPLRLVATTDVEAALKGAEFVVIAVPTNYDSENNSFNTAAIEKVIEDTLRFNSDALMVIKSTIPLGYTQSMRERYLTDRIAFCPEFLRESRALYDSLHPSRIIMSDDTANQSQIKAFVSLLLEGASKKNIDVLYMNSTEAEAVKLFANTFLAMRVAFFNELDTYAETENIKAENIIRGISSDPRIGNYYNNPSLGYGGYCLPKDTKQLSSDFNTKNIDAPLITSITKSNEQRKEHAVNQIMKKALKNNSDGVVTIGVFRLVMKSKSDNFREAAVIDIIKKLKEKGATVIIYEPLINDSKIFDCRVESDISKFKEKCNIIVANRVDNKLLEDVKANVYSRDIYNID